MPLRQVMPREEMRSGWAQRRHQRHARLRAKRRALFCRAKYLPRDVAARFHASIARRLRKWLRLLYDARCGENKSSDARAGKECRGVPQCAKAARAQARRHADVILLLAAKRTAGERVRASAPRRALRGTRTA